MSDLNGLSAHPGRIFAEELRKLPAAERDRILEAQARIAEQFYRNDPELTAFETFGEDGCGGGSMTAWRRGEVIEFDGVLAAVVGIEGDPGVPEDHVVLWFGEPKGERKSRGGAGGLRPVVHTVPAGYCKPALKPEVRH